MPNGNPNTPFQFTDTDGTRYAIEASDAHAGNYPIRVRVASGGDGGIGIVYDMTTLAAQRFSMMLSAALTAAIQHR
jgi:hypothetical protein